MDNLNNMCLICFCIKKDLHPLSIKGIDEVTYLTKLTVFVPEVCTELLNEHRLICKQCCYNIDNCYKFRKKCLKSKALLLNYASIHMTENENHTNDKESTDQDNVNIVNENNKDEYAMPENVVIKTEVPDEDDQEEYTYMHLDKVKAEIEFEDKSTDEPEKENSPTIIGSEIDNANQAGSGSSQFLIPPIVSTNVNSDQEPVFQIGSRIVHRLRRRDGPTKTVRKRCRECYQTLKREFGKKVADGRTKKVVTYCIHCVGQPTLCLECFNNIH